MLALVKALDQRLEGTLQLRIVYIPRMLIMQPKSHLSQCCTPV